MKREHGSAIVETAFSITILLTMIMGIMTVSLGLYTYHYISDAAREGTRWAMVRGSACQGFASACPAAASDVSTYVKSLGFPGINASAMTVTTTWPSGNNNPGSPVKVTVEYNFSLTVPFLTARTLNLISSSQMIISQ